MSQGQGIHHSSVKNCIRSVPAPETAQQRVQAPHDHRAKQHSYRYVNYHRAKQQCYRYMNYHRAKQQCYRYVVRPSPALCMQHTEVG